MAPQTPESRGRSINHVGILFIDFVILHIGQCTHCSDARSSMSNNSVNNISRGYIRTLSCEMWIVTRFMDAPTQTQESFLTFVRRSATCRFFGCPKIGDTFRVTRVGRKGLRCNNREKKVEKTRISQSSNKQRVLIASCARIRARGRKFLLVT